MTQPDSKPIRPASREGAYEVVSFGNTWLTISFVCGLLALQSRRWIGLLPWQLQGYHLIPPVAVLVVPPLSGLGVLSGWLAVRRQPGSLASRLALLLNLVVFSISSLLIVAFWVYRRLFAA